VHGTRLVMLDRSLARQTAAAEAGR
jgi:hypothetical protein